MAIYTKIAGRPVAAVALSAILAAMMFSGPARADTISTAGKQAIVIDFNTGTVLLDKNAEDQMVPSSMSKLMTVYMVFERLKKGSLKLTDKLSVSETAWRRHYKTGESLMFLPVNSQVTVEELLRGVIVQSGNDACSVLAEGLAGSEAAFADLETKRAAEIGLVHSQFKNASGVPEPGHYMTAHDLATLATRLIKDFPEYYSMFDERKFVYNNINQDNRNPLFYRNVEGADGLKTGHTEDGGYGVTGTALRNGRRVIVVVNGLASIKSRADKSQNLIEWGFREFEDRHLFKAGDSVGDAPVWLGEAPTVPITAAEDITATVPRSGANDLKVTAAYDAPIPAPVKKGQKVGTLTIDVPSLGKQQIDLIAGGDVERLGAFGRMMAAAKHLLGGS